MAVALLILKIIGYILLGILALFLLMLLLMLFGPVTYRLKGGFENDLDVSGYISYLGFLLRITYKYKDGFSYKVRILGIPIKLKTKKTDKGSADSKDNASKPQDKADSVKDEVRSEESGPDNKEKIRNFLNILQSDVTKNAFLVCKKRMGILLKNIFPDKVRINIEYGLDDPFYSSMVLALYNVLYIYLDKKINIYPRYDGACFKSDFDIKGHLISAPILIQTILVLFDSNCREFFKIIRNK